MPIAKLENGSYLVGFPEIWKSLLSGAPIVVLPFQQEPPLIIQGLYPIVRNETEKYGLPATVDCEIVLTVEESLCFPEFLGKLSSVQVNLIRQMCVRRLTLINGAKDA